MCDLLAPLLVVFDDGTEGGREGGCGERRCGRVGRGMWEGRRGMWEGRKRDVGGIWRGMWEG